MSSLASAALCVCLVFFNVWEWQWNLWQSILVTFVAFELGGGLVGNMLNSSKRYYHAQSVGEENLGLFFKYGFGYERMHIQTVLIGCCVPTASAINGVVWYILLLLAARYVRTRELYLRRPIAFAAIGMSVVGNQYLLPLGAGVEWVVPLVFMKLIYGRVVREEPYRPIDGEI